MSKHRKRWARKHARRLRNRLAGKNRHHRQCESNGGHAYVFKGESNVVNVDSHRHALWHQMFGNMFPEEIVDEINKLWLDPRVKLVLERR